MEIKFYIAFRKVFEVIYWIGMLKKHIIACNYHYCYFTPCDFFSQQLMGFYWRLSDSKSPQVPRTLLSILDDLINSVVWMVSVLLRISNSSSRFSKLLGVISSTPTTNDITVTLTFKSFFLVLWQNLSIYLFACFYFYTEVRQNSKIISAANSFFVNWYEVRSSNRSLVFHLYLKIPENFMRVILSQKDCFVHDYQWITFPSQSFLVLFSFLACLLHSFIIWVTT